jgi:Cd2+/Zn2+-exporting ATPase
MTYQLQRGGNMSQQIYNIGNLDCANCAKELETGINKLKGVEQATVDFANMRLLVSGDVPFTALQKRTQEFGHSLHEAEAQNTPKPQKRGGIIGFWDYLLSRHDTRLALVGVALVLVGLLVAFAGYTNLSPIIYTAALIIAVYPIAKSGLNTLRINHQFSINLLMTIAGIGALVIGEYLEAATVVFLFSIGEALEGYVTNQARDSLKSLLELKPTEALLLQNGRELSVHVDSLQLGDKILVKAGERIPMDGTVAAGTSGVNQAPITGESIPVTKEQGDEVFAGTINENGTLEIEVTRLAQDNTLNRIIQMVEEAQSQRAPSQRLIDQFAHYYTPSVVVIAALVATIPPLFFGAPFMDTAVGHGWLYRALTMLVIACPCALVISTPVTVISAITAAARRGVLIKGGAHLEALGTVKSVAFDKTGTLTEGRPVVMAVRSVDCETGELCELCDDVLALAAAVESRSTHPLAQAVVDEAQSRQLASRYSTAQDVKALTGLGVKGQIDGREIVVGSHNLFDSEFAHSDALCDMVKSAEANGQTTMLLHDGERVRGYIAVADKVRQSSAGVVSALNALNLQTVMLTGDNPTVAQAVGDKVGVTDIRASLLPDDKVTAVRGLMQSGAVAMVGDGINDTPALATATVGIAMGGAGSAQAMETADIALMGDDLSQLPFAIKLARFARNLILQNVVLAIAMKLLFLTAAVFGGVSMWAAIFADVGMSLIVTLNGMRPLRRKA